MAGRTQLPDSVIDIRRVSYLPSSAPGPIYTPLVTFSFVGLIQIPLSAPWTPIASGVTLGGQQYGPAKSLANEATNTINSNGQADSTYNGVLFPNDQYASVTIVNAGSSSDSTAAMIRKFG